MKACDEIVKYSGKGTNFFTICINGKNSPLVKDDGQLRTGSRYGSVLGVKITIPNVLQHGLESLLALVVPAGPSRHTRPFSGSFFRLCSRVIRKSSRARTSHKLAPNR